MKNKSGLTLIKKANNLIESRYKFDIWETRFFLSVLAQIHRDDKDFQVYRIHYKDIIKTFGLSSKQSYGFLREGASSLMKKVLYITSMENGVEVETQYHLIRTIRYLKELNENKEEVFLENQEYIDVTVDPEMKPLLLQLRDQGGFTFYELKNAIKLGVYALRIYELLKQYQKIGSRKIKIQSMREMFELTTEYPLVSHFYERVVHPSIKEINKHTDLQVDTPQKIKEGRKIVALLFTFRKKESSFIVEPEPTIDFKKEVETAFETISSITPSPVVAPTIPTPAPKRIQETSNTDALYTEFEPDVVKSFGVTPFVLMQLIQNYDADLIRKQIRITKRKRGASPTSNIAGFFVNAVKTDYNDPVEAKEAQKQARQAENEVIRRAAEKKQQTLDAIVDITNMINTGVNNTIRKLVANDPTITARAIEYATERIITDRTLFNAFRQKGYDFEKIDLETWRNEVFLRNQVIEAMQKLEPKSFLYLSSLMAELEELKKEMTEL
jgi:plasmid replication initiation protein